MTTARDCVLLPFVSAPPTGPAQAPHPNPPRQPAPAQGGSNIGRVIGVVSWLITYGKDLTSKLRQHAGTPAFVPLAKRFGTTDLIDILRRITRGLMIAAALHERLARRAARGRDITPPPLRMPKPRKPLTLALESPESPPSPARRRAETRSAFRHQDRASNGAR